MCEKLDNLFDYRDLRPLLRKAEQDGSYFLHVISIIYDAIKNSDSRRVLQFLIKWRQGFENFLAITFPKWLITSVVESNDMDPNTITENFLHILECFLHNSYDNFQSDSNLKNESFYGAVLWVLSCLEVVIDNRDQSLFYESELKNVVTKLKTNVTSRMSSNILHDHDQCVKSIKDLSVIPEIEDLVKKTEGMECRIKRGDYNSIEHYLDLNFRLIREDMLCGLRKGVNEFKSRMKEKKTLNVDFECVRVYRSIKLKDAFYGMNGKLYKFHVKLPQTVDFETTKRMKPGNLLCLTKNHFQTVIFVSIAKRHPLEGEGNSCTISVKVEAENKENVKEDINMYDSYVMLEPENYFESYRHILSNMKTLQEGNFPFGSYLVKPLSVQLGNSMFSGFDSDSVENFMRKESLDTSQKEAVNLALKHPISLIHGPPGTGKTYVGLRIVKFMFDSSNQQSNEIRRPILIMCYTNHALDKFLEGILSFNTRVIRVGGQSDSDKLKPYVLSNILHAVSQFGQTKRIRNPEEMHEMSPELQLSLDIALDLMPNGFPYDKTGSLRFHVLNKIVEYINKKTERNSADSEIFSREILDSMMNEKFKKAIMGDDSNDIVHSVREWLFVSAQDEGELSGEVMDLTNKLSDTQYRDIINKDENSEKRPHDPLKWKLPERKKWFCMLRSRYFKRVDEQIKMLKDLLRVSSRQILTEKVKYEYSISKNADVIGFTTTGAAKYRELLEMLKPEIVLVEEAAEVDELHIVASVPSSVKHLILIGDHEQLKPTPACHHLSSEYNLNLSLFERLYYNRTPCVSLRTQRRMRPSICRLLVPLIYKNLSNHIVVELYNNIRGTGSNTFFINHEFQEVERNVEKTHWNMHEAKFVAALTHYLIKQHSYECNQITVLTMYSGQQKILKKLFELKDMSEVLVSTVDGFQGEENHIVIVSFVRSNDKDEIGFLESSNRVCVALSRAMGGLYCIGNFELYAKKKVLWHTLVEKLKENSEFGEKMPLRSEDGKIDYVSSAGDFIKTCPNSSAECDFYNSLESFTFEDLIQK